jgi:hypothetical protein
VRLLLSTRSRKPGPRARLCVSLIVLSCAVVGAASSPAAATAAPLLGANLDLIRLREEHRAQELARLSASGVCSIRMPLDWNRVEPQPGQFLWQEYDAVVDAALDGGFEVVLILGPCAEWAVDPAWHVPPGELCCSIPQSLDVWERYARAAVSHFKGRVRYWQVRKQPNMRNFRGAHREYLRLLAAAARQAREIDPAARIIAPEAGYLDVAAADRLLCSPARNSCDVLGFYLPADHGDLSRVLLPWAVLTHEVLGQAQAEPRRSGWVLGGEEGISPDLWAAYYCLAWAFGVERCYLPAEAVTRDFAAAYDELRYRGFLSVGPDLWALVFDGATGPVVMAWSPVGLEVPVTDIAPIADGDLVAEAALVPGEPSSSAPKRPAHPAPTVRIGARPVALRGLAIDGLVRAGAPTRRDVLAARPRPNLSALPMIYADYSMPERPEFGLSNRSLRQLRGGAITEELAQGRAGLRTHMTCRRGDEELDNPWIYFDVDDGWLYFDRGKSHLAITVECQGCPLGLKKLGFNIMYDAVDGYRFTRWRWVDPGYGWHAYRFELSDVSFANRDGYDFRINAKGSNQDAFVTAVTLHKVPCGGDGEGAWVHSTE